MRPPEAEPGPIGMLYLQPLVRPSEATPGPIGLPPVATTHCPVGLNDLSFSTENRDLKHYDFGIVKAAFFFYFILFFYILQKCNYFDADEPLKQVYLRKRAPFLFDFFGCCFLGT